jgi:hypothetical protein
VNDDIFRKKLLKTQEDAVRKYFKNRTGKILLDYIRKLNAD